MDEIGETGPDRDADQTPKAFAFTTGQIPLFSSNRSGRAVFGQGTNDASFNVSKTLSGRYPDLLTVKNSEFRMSPALDDLPQELENHGEGFHRALSALQLSESANQSSAEESSDASFTPSSRRTALTFPSLPTTPSHGRSQCTDLAGSNWSKISRGDGDDSPTSTGLAPQTKTFEQLAQDQGFRGWSSSAFDDRWTIKSDENSTKHSGRPFSFARANNEDPFCAPRLTLTAESSAKDTIRATSPPQDVQKSTPYRLPKPPRLLDPKGYKELVMDETILMPLPVEAQRLETLVKEVAQTNQLEGMPSKPHELYKALLRYLFGADVVKQMGPVERELQTVYQGKEITLGELRSRILLTVDELTRYLFSPACKKEQQDTTAVTDTVPFVPKDTYLPSMLDPLGPRSPPLRPSLPSADSGWVSDPMTNATVQHRSIQASNVRLTQSQSQSTMFSMPAMEQHYSFGGARPDLVPQQAFGQFTASTRMHSTSGSMYSMMFRNGQQSAIPGTVSQFVPMRAHTFGTDQPLLMQEPGYGMLHERSTRPPAPGRLAPSYARNGMWQDYIDKNVSTLPKADEAKPKPPLATVATKPAVTTLSYREHDTCMYPEPSTTGAPSLRLQVLIQQTPPSLQLLRTEQNLPFVESAATVRPAEWGVLRISNIPYDVAKISVKTFLGNHAKLITGDFGPAIHVVMDRATGKTQDCFAEFFSKPDAQVWVNVIKGRSSMANRIGERVLQVELSSQEDILKELFPRAKNIRWEAGQPSIVECNDPYNSGFKVFVTSEELQSMIRHAEQPHRCPNRPYEAMISLLSKFPWYATAYYTLELRNKIFDTTKKMISLLCQALKRQQSGRGFAQHSFAADFFNGPMGLAGNFAGHQLALPSGRGGLSGGASASNANLEPLNTNLLRDLLSAGLNAAGFSERQRWELYVSADFEQVNRRFRVSPLAQYWPFEVLGRRRDVDEDVVEFYARFIAGHPLVSRAPGAGAAGVFFGDLKPNFFADVQTSCTLEEMAHVEWRALWRILRDRST